MAVAVSGSQDFSTTNLIDGVPTKSPEYGGIGYQLPLEMVDEFNIQRGFYSAKYSGPGVVNVVSRSGKNEIHGVLWYTFGNDVLDAKNYFDKRSRLYGKTNLAGLSVARSSRIACFISAISRWRAISSASPCRAPSPPPLNSEATFQIFQHPIINPFTKTQYPGNVIPAASLDTFAKAYIGLGNRADSCPHGAWRRIRPNQSNRHQ